MSLPEINECRSIENHDKITKLEQLLKKQQERQMQDSINSMKTINRLKERINDLEQMLRQIDDTMTDHIINY